MPVACTENKKKPKNPCNIEEKKKKSHSCSLCSNVENKVGALIKWKYPLVFITAWHWLWVPFWALEMRVRSSVEYCKLHQLGIYKGNIWPEDSPSGLQLLSKCAAPWNTKQRNVQKLLSFVKMEKENISRVSWTVFFFQIFWEEEHIITK